MTFLKSVFNNYRTVGAISPSSRFLYKKMISPMDLTHDIHIVEFGAGDGTFTDALLQKITQGSRISIFEIDPSFIKKLQSKYKNENRIVVYPLGAEESIRFFDKGSIDYILSSLPFGLMKTLVVFKILESAKHILKENGKYIQFQYFLQNKKEIHHIFPKVRYKFTFLNLPPAFIYICKK
ncbi:methyltransferase [Candidatus Gracilibacteria bacterium]|nr:methyltransferase [Candidatus Gracilibacteria bacterium]OIO76595.1 MAG: hypothetical protein AUJ87_02450 [Candidatus Gracilibacteria bacterium CG1_02_38_174]